MVCDPQAGRKTLGFLRKNKLNQTTKLKKTLKENFFRILKRRLIYYRFVCVLSVETQHVCIKYKKSPVAIKMRAVSRLRCCTPGPICIGRERRGLEAKSAKTAYSVQATCVKPRKQRGLGRTTRPSRARGGVVKHARRRHAPRESKGVGCCEVCGVRR